jgi:hypothetical protein
MKKFITYFSVIASIILFAACQKELMFDAVAPTGEAEGTFQVNSAGSCFPFSISGIYIKDTALNTNNFIEVAINVTKAGTYKISTDTVAGMYFSDSGTFARVQTETIILKGKGIPTSTGIKEFTVKFGNQTSCKFFINVTTGGITNPIAVFNFVNCSNNVSGSGVYTAGVPTGAFHTLMLNVFVTSPGTYTASTGNPVNGLVFTASGFFNGINSPSTLILTASGTPTNVGTFTYTVTNGTGTASCTFTITVNAAPPSPNLDYIPMTTNTNWSNRIIPAPTPPTLDTTFLQVSPNQKTFGANSYYIFERKEVGVIKDSSFFRKGNGLYYQYIADRVANQNVPINKEYLVLDSTKALNVSWSTNLGNIIVGGFPLDDFTIAGKITAKGTTQIVEAISYSNVIIVKYDYTANVFGLPLTIATEERWFAKGIGVIKSVINIQQPTPSTIETRLTRSQIF